MYEDLPTPETVAVLTPWQLAAKVRIDQTESHEAAVAWSNFAVLEARRLDVRAVEPTLAGEVYRNRALRLELWGKPVEDVDDAVHASLTELENRDNPKIARERAATLSVLGRIARHRILTGSEQGDIHDIRTYHDAAQRIFHDQHPFFKTWDRYATMDDQQRAMSEATVRKGSTMLAVGISLRGMWRALRAESEGRPKAEHLQFVRKQLGVNALAGFVAASQPARAVPGIHALRQKARQKLLD